MVPTSCKFDFNIPLSSISFIILSNLVGMWVSIFACLHMFFLLQVRYIVKDKEILPNNSHSIYDFIEPTTVDYSTASIYRTT